MENDFWSNPLTSAELDFDNEIRSDYGAGSGIQDTFVESWLTPGVVRKRELAENLEAQRYADRVKASDLMEGAKRAGINANVAAAGIAGVSTAAQTPASAVPSGAASAGSAAQAVDAVSSAFGEASNVYEKLSLVNPSRKNSIADTFLKYKQAGYQDQAAYGLAIANQFLSEEKMLGIVRLNQDIENLREQYHFIHQQTEESKARVKEIDEQINYLKAEGKLAEAKALEADRNAELLFQKTEEANWLNEMRKNYDIDPRSPIENNIFMMGIKDDPKYSKSLDIVYDLNYNKSLAMSDAELQNAFDIAFDQAKANLEVNTEYMPYRLKLEASKDILLELVKSIYQNPQNLRSGIAKYVNQLYNILKDDEIGQYDVARPVLNAPKPPKGHPNR